MHYISNAAKFLLDTGLLGEINRLVLHPRGLALAINAEDDGTVTFYDELYDCRRDPEGIMMGPDLCAEIKEKLKTAPPLCQDREDLFGPGGIEPL